MPPHPRPSCWRASTTRPRCSRRAVNQPRCSTAPSPACAVVDRALQGVAGVLALAGHADLDAAISARLDGLDATVARLEAGIETPTTSRRRRARRRRGGAERRAGRGRDVLWALRHDRLRTARAVADLAGRDAPPLGAGRLHGRPGGALGARPAGGAGPRLGRAAPARLGPRAGSGERRGGPAAGRPGRRRPLRLRRGPAWPTGTWPSSTRPRPRSASWATTPRRCAPPCATTGCSTSRSGRRRPA